MKIMWKISFNLILLVLISNSEGSFIPMKSILDSCREGCQKDFRRDYFYISGIAGTVFFSESIIKKNGTVPILYSSLQKSTQLHRTTRMFEILPGELEII